MTLVDLIEVYNLNSDRDIDDVEGLFEDIDIDERLDKDILINSILDECGAMQVLYNTTGVFKRFSDNFFKKYKWSIGKLLDTLELRYDPIANKNMEWTETTQIEQNLDTSEEHDEDRTKTNTGTESNQYNDDSTNTISAMNSDTYQPDNKSVTNGGNTRTDNLSEVINSDVSRTKNEALDWDETDKHIEKGADSVVFQDLIEKERKVAQFSIYNWITKKYAKELFLLVY